MKKIILVGKAACGKDYLSNWLIKHKGFIKSILYTTRPIRENEVDNKDYHFIDRETFLEMISDNKFKVYQEFNGWYYGDYIEDFDKCNLFIKTPGSIRDLTKKQRNKCLIIFLDIDEYIRKERLNKRGDIDSVNRRIASDEIDFKDFENYDLKINNINHPSEIYKLFS